MVWLIYRRDKCRLQDGSATEISGRHRQRIGPLAEDRKIALIAENTPSLAPGDLFYEAHPFQIGKRRIDRGCRQAGLPDKLVGRQERILLEEIMDTEPRNRAP